MAEPTNEMSAPGPMTPHPVTPELLRKISRPEHDVQDPAPANAVARSTPDRMARALEHARLCARIADDNRGKEILLLDLRPATPLVDYFVIITANSRRLGRAIAEEIDKEMKRLGEFKIGYEGSEEGRWTLIDYGDFVVHVFSIEARAYYSLEDIWGDAPHVDWQDPTRVRPTSRAEAVGEADEDDADDDLDDDINDVDEIDADTGTGPADDPQA
jgi:ribosome-associated protein